MSGTKIEQDSGLPFNSKGQLMLRADGVPADAYKVKGRSYTNARDLYTNISIAGSNSGGFFQTLADFLGNNVKNLKNDFGALGDGSDDDDAVQRAVAWSNDNASPVWVPPGTYQYTTSLDFSKGAGFIGPGWLGSILWYSGSDYAIKMKNVGGRLMGVHITSLDPSTTGHLTSNNAGTGSASVGVLIEHVDVRVWDCAISYFNDANKKAAAIRTNGNVGFSGSIKDNYIRYCWGGISLEDTVTDTTILDNTILDVEKYGISIGYDWNASAFGTLVGSNFRLQNNLIQNVNRGFNDGGNVGEGYAIFLANGSIFDIRGNYIEDYYAETGDVAYGIFASGISDGSTLLGIEINNNNIVTSYSGTKLSVHINNAWYGGGSGNQFDSGTSVDLSTGARYFDFGQNFFTGGPATPYALSGTRNRALDLLNSKIISSSDLNLQNDISTQSTNRKFDEILTFTANDSTPAVNTGNTFKTANTMATTITDFDSGASGQEITVLISDGNTTIDFTSSGLKGNAGVDWSPANGDHMVCKYDGTDWRCVISDNTA